MRTLCAAAAVFALAGVCLASDPWEKKDPSTWTSVEIDKLTHDSPWAQAAKVQMSNPNGGDSNAGGNSGGGYPGGGGGRRGGMGGLGLPFPGGGWPGGGGGGGGRGGGRGGRPSAQTVTAIVRWDSALPLRQAYALQAPPASAQSSSETPEPGFKRADAPAAVAPEAAQTNPQETPKEYIIAVTGFPLSASNRGARRRDDDSQQSSRDNQDSDQNPDKARYGRDADTIREELMERTTLARGGGRATLRPVKVEFDLPGKLGIIYFHFSREDAITLKDKELLFQTALGGNRLERKFDVKEMVYRKNLEL
jgi:hypothetical protein